MIGTPRVASIRYEELAEDLRVGDAASQNIVNISRELLATRTRDRKRSDIKKRAWAWLQQVVVGTLERMASQQQVVLHDEYGIDGRNDGDLPMWDMLFGSFVNPHTINGRVGFDDHAKQANDMLLMRDVKK